MRKLKIIMLKKVRDACQYMRMRCDKKAKIAVTRLNYYYRIGFPLKHKRIIEHLKMYDSYTTRTVLWADRVGKCNEKIIKIKAS